MIEEITGLGAVTDEHPNTEQMLFAHANGFPPGAYADLFQHLSSRFLIDVITHRPLWGARTPPRRLRWQLFVDDLLRAMDARYDHPVVAAGHSMGGTIAALAACREPERFRSLVLLDPVFESSIPLLKRRVLPLAVRRRREPLIRGAYNRPGYFSSNDEAFDFYRGKRAFRRFDDRALRAYVDASLGPNPEGGVRLLMSPAWEAAIYQTVPFVSAKLRKLTVPVAALIATEGSVVTDQMLANWERSAPMLAWARQEGTHLFPLEHPQATADAIRGFFDRAANR